LKLFAKDRVNAAELSADQTLMLPLTAGSQCDLSLHDLVRKQSHPRLAFEDTATLKFDPLLPEMVMKKASLVTSRDTLLDE